MTAIWASFLNASNGNRRFPISPALGRSECTRLMDGRSVVISQSLADWRVGSGKLPLTKTKGETRARRAGGPLDLEPQEWEGGCRKNTRPAVVISSAAAVLEKRMNRCCYFRSAVRRTLSYPWRSKTVGIPRNCILSLLKIFHLQ